MKVGGLCGWAGRVDELAGRSWWAVWVDRQGDELDDGLGCMGGPAEFMSWLVGCMGGPAGWTNWLLG